MESILDKIKKAEKKAKKEIYAGAKKKKKRSRKNHVDSEGIKLPLATWVKDAWGNQGEVFFDGYNYWGIALVPRDGEQLVTSQRWTPEEWENRKVGEVKDDERDESGRGSLERGTVAGTIQHNKSATKPSGKRGKSAHRKTRASKSLPGGKRSKLAKDPGNNGKKVRKTIKTVVKKNKKRGKKKG